MIQGLGRLFLEAHPASCSMGTEALSPEVKWPGYEADHLASI